MKDIESLTNFLYELGTLRKTLRSHRQTLLTDDLSDNIASHSYRASMIAYFLAKAEGADIYKTILMAMFHDAEEARSGDQNWLHKRYVKTFNDEIVQDQLKGLPGENELVEINQEYDKRETLEAKLAKDADLLDEILLLKEYAWQGNKESQEWLDGNEQGKRLFSKTAKELCEQIKKTKPSKWWRGLWSAERR